MYAMDDWSPGNDWLDSGGLDLADALPDGGLVIEDRKKPGCGCNGGCGGQCGDDCSCKGKGKGQKLRA